MPSIFRSPAAFTNPHKRAGLLLAVLLTHLLFMASPLHDAMLGSKPAHAAEASAPSVAQLSSDQGEVVALDATSHHEYHSHCGLEWATVPRGMTQITMATGADATAAVIEGLNLQRAVTPIARAVGPPPDGDAQAVLQVFRL